MLKFKKVFNSGIVSMLTSILFFVDLLYASPLPSIEDQLRAPIGTHETYKRIDRVLPSKTGETTAVLVTLNISASTEQTIPQEKTVAILGASGFLGKKVYNTFLEDKLGNVIGTSFSKHVFYHLDVTNEDAIKDFIGKFNPEVIVYAAAEANPDIAEKEPSRALALNVNAVKVIAKYFKGHFIYMSSDYIFDGVAPPYRPEDLCNPLNEYGRTKMLGEQTVLESKGFNKVTIVRAGLLYGYNDADDRITFVKKVVDSIENKEELAVDDEQIRHPVLIDDVAYLILDIVKNSKTGIFQINGEDSLTQYGFAQLIVEIYCQLNTKETVDVVKNRIHPTTSTSQVKKPFNAHMVNSVVPTILKLGVKKTLPSISRYLKPQNAVDSTIEYNREIFKAMNLPFQPSIANMMTAPSVKKLISELVKKGYDEDICRRIIYDHLRRLVQREEVNMTQQKWIDRMRLAVEWWYKFRKTYTYELVNVFGATEEEKQNNVQKVTEEFRQLLEQKAMETGNKFFVYSGGSGVGKSTIWTELLLRYPNKFKKFLIYTTRERRADEDVDFKEDLNQNFDRTLWDALTIILNNGVPDYYIGRVTADNIEQYKKKLFSLFREKKIILEGRSLNMLNKILDLSKIGNGGRRISQAFKQKSIQNPKVTLSERIGMLTNGKIRVYGEFDGVTYYFVSEQELEDLVAQELVTIFSMGKLKQGLSFKEVNEAMAEKGDLITVLETTPEITQALKKEFGDLITFFISPFSGDGYELPKTEAVNLTERKLLRPGGSTNLISIVEKNRTKRFRKTASDSWERDKQKFIDQVRWLKSLPRNLQPYFPKILEDNIDGTGPFYYETELYRGKTLTQLIIEDEKDAGLIQLELEKIMKFWRDTLIPSKEKNVGPQDRYAEKMIESIESSLEEVEKRAPLFSVLLTAPTIRINGRLYKNLLPLLKELKQNSQVLSLLQPPKLMFTHGDFHFDNMFICNDGSFLLLDPRGDEVGDPVYDLAKLAHTMLGKYDILHYGLHETELHTDGGMVSLDVRYPMGSPAWQVYEQLARQFPELVNTYYGDTDLARNDPYWRERLLFSYMKIMANLPIYHLQYDGKEERSLALYADGVIILNNFIDLFNKSQLTPPSHFDIVTELKTAL